MKTNLSKALKIKNRVAGELAKQQGVLRRENSRRSDNPSQINVEEVVNTTINLRAKLIAIKSAITQANINIYPALCELEEVKSQIAFLGTVPVREGTETVAVGYSKETKDHNWVAYYNQERIDQEVNKLQKIADALQDKVDAYNAITIVELPD